MLVLGILAMAGEFRHGTITPTLLAAPRRGMVVAAKMLTFAVSVGSLLRNPALAVAVALLWSFVLEGLLVGLLPEVGRWLPGGAGQGLARSSTTAGDLLPMWGGGLLLAGYGVLFALVGSRFVVRRDIT